MYIIIYIGLYFIQYNVGVIKCVYHIDGDSRLYLLHLHIRYI